MSFFQLMRLSKVKPFFPFLSHSVFENVLDAFMTIVTLCMSVWVWRPFPACNLSRTLLLICLLVHGSESTSPPCWPLSIGFLKIDFRTLFLIFDYLFVFKCLGGLAYLPLGSAGTLCSLKVLQVLWSASSGWLCCLLNVLYINKVVCYGMVWYAFSSENNRHV